MSTVERWQQVEEIFHEALQREPAQRELHVHEACRGDSGLLREVLSLLANRGDSADCEPWPARAAAQLIVERVSLTPGQRLGPYRVDRFIAAGGMGEIYRATDTRLSREVAVKVSPARFSQRFEKEATVIASLNHPNICRLYDVGRNYLVMELVEGRTLAERIQRGPLPVSEALGIARQIAEALEAAHENGKTHRDLKPANIKITPEGVVKLLDFGLAEAEPAGAAGAAMASSRANAIAGTPAYMSPEQTSGSLVDKRTDIWAFGAVLYEMLTGKVAFPAATIKETLATEQGEPDWSALPATIPPRIRNLIARCLEPERRQRLRDIGEARIALETLNDQPAETARLTRRWLVTAGVLIIVAVAAWGWWMATRPSAPPRALMRASINLDPGAVLANAGFQNVLAISPDGRRLVFTARRTDGILQLAARMLDQSGVTLLPGTEGAQGPFFSPDSEWIGFFADEKLKKISVRGGAPIIVSNAPGPRGASWGDDGNIIAALSLGNAGLSRIPAGGGAPTAVPEVKGRRKTAHRWPQVLPGSRWALFTAYHAGDDTEGSNVELLSLETGETKTLAHGYFGRYLPSGHLVFVRQNTLFAAPLDLRRLVVTATAQPVLDDVSGPAYSGARHFDFSRDGTFVYLSGAVGNNQMIYSVDSTGELSPLRPEPGQYYQPRFSPDGKRLTFSVATGQSMDIWVQDLERRTSSRRSLLPGRSWWPLWTPDGARIVFSTGSGSRQDLYWIRADGSGEATRLADEKIQGIPRSFFPDGSRLAFNMSNGTSGATEIWTAPLEGDSEHLRLGEATRFVDAATPVPDAQFSPDGRWMAYVSAELGRTEIFVRPFPGPGGTWQISTGGGRFPVWSRNGHDLLFVGPDQRIRVVSYTSRGDSFSPGSLRLWCAIPVADLGVNRSYDLAPDGKRLAVILPADEVRKAKPTSRVDVLINFFDELRRQLPTAVR
jgi:Tol biopolymer transport system component